MKYDELQLVVDVPEVERIEYAQARSRCTSRRPDPGVSKRA
jgi:hypothetical protein